ncbi:MAG: DUF2934 domain-containing protein [Phycisphaerales bacterium]|nr:DUF2934 domain-containing protein [Phycisphaerales bacterium]
MSHRSKPSASHPSAATSLPCASAADASCCPPSAELIRERAYAISQVRNGGPGNAQADWTQAEQELAAALVAKG